ncbi:MAG: hypothetical protein WAQ57_00645 [Candidatus Saccharimonadales bacterium]
MINSKVLMSGADYFSDTQAINAYMDAHVAVDIGKAAEEHNAIRMSLESAGTEVIKIQPPSGCQDGVYTANWALTRGQKAVMSRLPDARKDEEAFAAAELHRLGFDIITVPNNWRFSGQGDALPCGNYLFCGSVYRTDAQVHAFLAETLGYEVIGLQTKPKRRFFGLGPRVTNKYSGWPDSYYYDLDLALAVIKAPNEETCTHGAPTLSGGAFSLQESDQGVQRYDAGDLAEKKRAGAKEASSAGSPAVGQAGWCGCRGLIAWSPSAFNSDSAAKIRALPVDKIEVSFKEAQHAFACNLVSTGETVVMSAFAPRLKRELEARGLKVLTPVVKELGKGGGYIRCTTLSLDNV